MRLPEIAVILATTKGSVVPIPSVLRKSTSRREVIAERRGTMKTSEYVRSYGGSLWRNRTVHILTAAAQFAYSPLAKSPIPDEPAQSQHAGLLQHRG
jgi:hypothetical protein